MWKAIEPYLPIILSVFALVFFTFRTRWLNYSIVFSAIVAESIPGDVNTTVLTGVVICLIGMLVLEMFRAVFTIEIAVVSKETEDTKNKNRLYSLA